MTTDSSMEEENPIVAMVEEKKEEEEEDETMTAATTLVDDETVVAKELPPPRLMITKMVSSFSCYSFLPAFSSSHTPNFFHPFLTHLFISRYLRTLNPMRALKLLVHSINAFQVSSAQTGQASLM